MFGLIHICWCCFSIYTCLRFTIYIYIYVYIHIECEGWLLVWLGCGLVWLRLRGGNVCAGRALLLWLFGRSGWPAPRKTCQFVNTFKDSQSTRGTGRTRGGTRGTRRTRRTNASPSSPSSPLYHSYPSYPSFGFYLVALVCSLLFKIFWCVVFHGSFVAFIHVWRICVLFLFGCSGLQFAAQDILVSCFSIVVLCILSRLMHLCVVCIWSL